MNRDRVSLRGVTDNATTNILEAINIGDLPRARALFIRAAAQGDIERLVMALSDLVEPKPSEITLGEGHLVFGNPLRDGWAWRCGHCLHAYRTGGRPPAAGVNYKTQRAAATAARKHSTEEHAGAVPVKVVTR
ncbi:hypothetical protein GCM10023085_44980 [Actinomadura viridis]|uniref:Uncharacterized protein n=1 Tax=Actinomadura viridis TaxID=58110 RepID=A0A931DGX0_9ACTN|nr:hypothetical protein [Actinomadura viridis]MBG6089860.1 hypothetical protein [Actinomadura viridis]